MHVCVCVCDRGRERQKEIVCGDWLRHPVSIVFFFVYCFCYSGFLLSLCSAATELRTNITAKIKD